MRKVLVISFDVPFDNVGHAGGKTHNFYLKKIKEDKEFEPYLISFGIPEHLPKLDLDKYGIDNKVFIIRPEKRYKLLRGVVNISSRYNPWNRYAGIIPQYYINKIMGHIKKMKENGYKPEIIVLEWTPIVLLAPRIKEVFPEAKIIASEHDVTFLGYRRKYEYETKPLKKAKKKIQYRIMRDAELKAIEVCDYVCPHNHKDAALLYKAGVPKAKIHPIVPFYMDFTDVEWKGGSNNIVFFGAMGREENHLSAMWFIDNIMPLLRDTDAVFQVIGGGPNGELKSRQSDKVQVLGFVDDVAPYFAEAACMAAPLVLGAGIKVKVIEGMSSGVPVLTNDIGIEGINAKDGEEYIHCETPEDYAKAIRNLLQNRQEAMRISKNAKKMIREKFDMERSAEKYIKMLRLGDSVKNHADA